MLCVNEKIYSEFLRMDSKKLKSENSLLSILRCALHALVLESGIGLEESGVLAGLQGLCRMSMGLRGSRLYESDMQHFSKTSNMLS